MDSKISFGHVYQIPLNLKKSINEQLLAAADMVKSNPAIKDEKPIILNHETAKKILVLTEEHITQCIEKMKSIKPGIEFNAEKNRVLNYFANLAADFPAFVQGKLF